MTSLQKSKSNFLLAMSLFGVVAVGGVAVLLSNNSAVNLKSGASNIDQNLSDKLVKRGTPAFSPCKDLDIKYTYALIGEGDQNNVKGAQDVRGPKDSPEPRRTGNPNPSARPSAKPENMPSSCTPLVVTAAMADPLVGKRVVVTGTFQSGVFYATAIKDANMPNDNSLDQGTKGDSGSKMTPNPRVTIEPRQSPDIFNNGVRPARTPVSPPNFK